jgi:hypothetical protein
MATPSAKTLNYLKKLGYIVQRVEQWNAFAHRRIDLFGIIDIVAVKADQVGVLGVQVTTMGNKSGHLDKAIVECKAKLTVWLAAGNRFEVHGWQGSKKLEVTPVLLKDGQLIRGAFEKRNDI